MAQATLTIDLSALAENWHALNRLSGDAEAAAVIKADAYGLGAAQVARHLANAGARSFFVALAEEGAAVRAAIGPGPVIAVLSGHMKGDAATLRDHALTPMLNSPEQIARHAQTLPGHPFGIQLDSGMNRLGLEPADWAAARMALPGTAWLVMSHLACADEPGHPQNTAQLTCFREMTAGLSSRRSLSATGGILLGPAYHFDLTRPGIGLYGGLPFTAARPVVRLSLPVIQCRTLTQGETVGYGASFQARGTTRIATLASGYADGILRALSNGISLYADTTPCPLAGRVSMDLLTVDITGLDHDPDHLDLICPEQGIDAVGTAAGTIGYEILTALGPRYRRLLAHG
ncbi:MAG: alanine racemase [Qingshengfaniella sp.]